MISNALAVHDLGAFELDGNAVNNGAIAGDDWDNVCHQVAGKDCTTGNNTSGANAVAWSNDCNDPINDPTTACVSTDPTTTSDRAASTFTGGGSKDPQNINAWAWNDGVGGLPDKDNLVHSYAARYNVTGTGAGDCAAGDTCDVIYFGLDRFDNSGDAQTGFWFLQNKCAQGTNKVGGGTGFACVDPTPNDSNTSDDFHSGFDTCTGSAPNFCQPGQDRKGDLLVLSDFSIGGTTSTISVYRWDPTCKKAGGKSGDGLTCGDANLAFLKGSSNANCGNAVLSGDDFCGLVNATTTNLPWSFTDKSGTASNGALNGEFYEAGINLTPLGLGGECFATIVSETRSSTSTTATLKDFVMAPFAPCQANLVTGVDSNSVDRDPGTGTQVNPTDKVRDEATITGNQAGKVPSGTVTFFLCKYDVGATDTTCPAGSGENIGTGTLSTVSGSIAHAFSPYVNCDPSNATGCAPNPASGTTGFTKNPLAPGHYCFRATWPGDANYTTPLVEDGSISLECFDVVVIPTDVKSKQSWYPNDTATISSAGTNDNLAAGGTVVFTLYSGDNCGATSGSVLYKETKTSVVPAGGAPSQQVATSNPGGGDAGTTSYTETTGYGDTSNTTTAARSWKVVYTPPSTDHAHTGSSSSCTTGHTEKHTYTYTNDPGTLP